MDKSAYYRNLIMQAKKAWEDSYLNGDKDAMLAAKDSERLAHEHAKQAGVEVPPYMADDVRYNKSAEAYGDEAYIPDERYNHEFPSELGGLSDIQSMLAMVELMKQSQQRGGRYQKLIGED